MKMTRVVSISLLACASILAQGPPPPGGGFGRRMEGPPGAGFGMHGGKVVTGAPYSADVSFTRTQTLLDGNVIQHTMSGKVARDAEGRTYSLETSTGGPLGQTGPVTRISIFDPVAGYAYELNPTTKTAVRRAIRQPKGNWKGPGSNAARPADPNAVKTDMGTQVVNNVNAQGTSTTRTIPAGTMGNEKPIVSTSETWYSADLQTVVAAKFTDPRSGQSSFALTNIQKTADPSLFQVPAGYTITDAPKGPRGQFERGGPPPPPQED